MEKEVEVQENKMGVMPVGKLLLSMSIPMMISMLVQALYNIVDSMFVAKLSENALYRMVYRAYITELKQFVRTIEKGGESK